MTLGGTVQICGKIYCKTKITFRKKSRTDWSQVILAEYLSSSSLSKNIKTYSTAILPVVWCGCETWSFPPTENNGWRWLGIRLWEKNLNLRGNEVNRKWLTLHNDMYCSPNIAQVIKSRIMRLAGHVARMGGRGVSYSVLVGKPDRQWGGDRGLDLCGSG